MPGPPVPTMSLPETATTLSQQIVQQVSPVIFMIL